MRIDRLVKGRMKFVQGKDVFCLNLDSVLLAGYPRLGRITSIIELGCGTGGVLLLLHQRKPELKLMGVEINKKAFEYMEVTLKMNNLHKSIEALNCDMRSLEHSYDAKFDLVISNPPYLKKETFRQPKCEGRRDARIETQGAFSDYAALAGRLLKNKGRFVFVHRCGRLPEISEELTNHGFSLKRMRFVHSFLNSAADKFLADAVKGAKPGVKVEQPLIVYRDREKYTEEVLSYYR